MENVSVIEAGKEVHAMCSRAAHSTIVPVVVVVLTWRHVPATLDTLDHPVTSDGRVR